MVKPVDGYSGLGITVCYGKEDIKPAVKKAIEISKSNRFIVERYMRCDDMGLYYTFKDGICSASCIYDRYTTEEQNAGSRVCLGGTYPSKHIDRYFERMHDNAVRMFRNIGIKNGVLMLSAFFENDEFYVYDTGFRLQGEAPHLIMNEVNGFDQREMLIRFALTGSEGDFDLLTQDDAHMRGKYAATVWFLLKEGFIDRIEGMDEVCKDSCVIANVQRLHVGDEVAEEWLGTEKQVLTRLYLVCNSKEELAEKIENCQNKIKVYDASGTSLIIKGFSAYEVLGVKR